MKTTLGFSTIACPDLPWREILDVGAAAGMKAVEIRLDREDRVFGLPDGELSGLKAALDARGMVCSDVGMGLALTDYRPGLDEKLSPVFERADQNMYENKEQLKAETGNDAGPENAE